MKVLVDVNLTPLWVEFFAAAGFESVHWTAVGLPSAPDTEIMDYAAAHSFVIFTHDLDFGTLLATRRAPGPSVIQLRTDDVLPSSVGAVVVRAIDACRTHLEDGALVTIDPNRHRIRVLPI